MFSSTLKTDHIFSHRGSHWLPRVESQGQSASCTIFATLSGLAALVARKHNRYVRFSHQHLIDHVSEPNSVGKKFEGIHVWELLEYLKHKGVVFHHQYGPYTGVIGLPTPVRTVLRVADYEQLNVNNFAEIKERIKNGIVIGVMYTFKSFESFNGNGIYTSASNDKYLGDHTVLITGFGGVEGIPFYEILNSWGPFYYGDGYLTVHRSLFKEVFVINEIVPPSDYRGMDERDQCEPAGLDDSFEDERDLDQIMADRRAAENDLEAKEADNLPNQRNRLPQMLYDQDTDDDNYRPSKRTRAGFRPPTGPRSIDDSDAMQSSPGIMHGENFSPMAGGNSGGNFPPTDDDQDDDYDGPEYEMYLVQGTLREWVTRDEVRRFIAKKFQEFLLTYVSPKNEQGDIEYLRQVNEMVAVNKCRLEIDYKQFIYIHPNIAIWLADAPQSVLEVMEEVANKVVFSQHPNYKKIHQKIYVRITNLPVYDQIRNIRQIHLNTMIRIGGLVTRRSGVFPQLQQVKYDGNKCGSVLGPFFQNSYSEVKVGSCPECQSKGPFTVNVEQTIYRNYQKLALQESPGIVPAGRLPRYKEVILLNDLIDCARPGEEIEVTGVYTNNFDLSLNTKNGFPVFATVIEANYITKKQDLFSAYKLTQEDKEEIEKLAKDPRIGERIMKSIAPSIYGHEDIKTAIALAILGGQEKNVGRETPLERRYKYAPFGESSIFTICHFRSKRHIVNILYLSNGIY